MRYLTLILVLILGGCGGDGTSPVCTRSDVGEFCSQGSSVELQGDAWVVTVRADVSETVEYTDDGHRCAYERRSCFQADCIFSPASSYTENRALEACKDQYGL